MILGLVLLVAGCSSSADAGESVAVPTPAGAVDCGTVTVGQGEAPPPDAVACLADAAASGRAARLAITRPTTEGDPIQTFYVARADGRVDVVTDGRQDRFGTREITRERCTGVAVGADGFLTLATCAPA